MAETPENQTTPAPPQNPKQKKKKGIIRTEAVVPFLIVILVCFLYFTFLFDSNLRMAFEWAGYEIIGAEVDIAKVETSFIHGTFRMQGIEVTNPNKPSVNMLQVGDIRFGILWDALLRARFVVNEMAVEKIEISVPRSHPGKIKPIPPPSTPSGEPSALEKEAGKVEDKALETTKNKYQGNVLGDIAGLLSGGGASDEQFKKS